MVTTPFLEKKSSTKVFDKGTDELECMLFTKKKSSTKYVDKGTDKLADMKEAVVTILRKGLYQFEGQSKGSKGWFKLESGLLKKTFYTSHPELYKENLRIILNIKRRNCIQRLL